MSIAWRRVLPIHMAAIQSDDGRNPCEIALRIAKSQNVPKNLGRPLRFSPPNYPMKSPALRYNHDGRSWNVEDIGVWPMMCFTWTFIGI
jgi:hypothetical protein